LDGGMFLFHPNAELWNDLCDFLATTWNADADEAPKSEFIADYFCYRWQIVEWPYSCTETMRQYHSSNRRDTSLVQLHYIAHRPWAKHPCVSGVAGREARFNKPYYWWWEAYREWQWQRSDDGKDGMEVLDIMADHVARPRTNVIDVASESSRSRIDTQFTAIVHNEVFSRDDAAELGQMSAGNQDESNPVAQDATAHAANDQRRRRCESDGLEGLPYASALRKKILGE